MKIRVTAEHIEKGRRGSCVACPIALAINDAFKPYLEALVSSNIIDFSYCDEETNIRHKVRRDTPKKLKAFIYAFDHQQPVYPFTFELRRA